MICVNSVSIYPKTLTLKVGDWYYSTLAVVCPDDATCGGVAWHSDNASVVGVNASSGYIYANAVGTARVYATAIDGSECCDYITVTVSDTVSVGCVTLDRSSLSLEEGKSTTLTATVCPDNASNKNLNWTSSNTSVATVSNGVVTAVAKGSARITATAADGSGKSASCTVTVTGDILVTSITVSPSNKTMTVGDSALLSVMVCPTDATKQSVCWSSSNTNIVTVNELSGLMIAQRAGTATICATACDGSGVVGCCTVIVNAPIMVECIGVCPETLTMKVGETAGLSAEAFPTNAKNKTIRWTSGDCTVAEVDFVTGCVTAIAAGSTYICANAQDGSGVRGCCAVTVNEPIVEDLVPGIRAIARCRVRKDMSMDDTAILKDSSGSNVVLEIGDTVPLLSTSTISANNRVWYRVLYGGMMVHVTADDNSFEELNIPAPPAPSGAVVQVNTGESNLNVRSTPSTDATKLGQFSNGTSVILTNETPQNESWFAVYGQMNDGTYSYGWCLGEYLGNYVEYGTLVDVDSLTVRSEAGTSSVSLGKIYKGNTVEVLEKNCATGSGYTWHKILYNGSVGYVVAGNNTPNFTFESRWVALVSENNKENYIVPTKASSNCVGFVAAYESFSATPYYDASGYLTIGYGHKIKSGESFTTITEQEALEILAKDMADAESLVTDYLRKGTASWIQQQYDAFVSLAFNAGNNFKYVVNDIVAGEDPHSSFAQISYSDGIWLLGLYRRRMDEADMFVYGTYNRTNRNAPVG